MEIKPQLPVYTATPNIHTWRLNWAVIIVALILLPSKSTQLSSLRIIPASYFSYSSLKFSQLKEQGEACSNTFTISRPETSPQNPQQTACQEHWEQLLYLSPGLETLELLEGLVNQWSLHLLEDQVFLGFQGLLGHLLEEEENREENLIGISAEILFSQIL